jgi:hypothetical protein
MSKNKNKNIEVEKDVSLCQFCNKRVLTHEYSGVDPEKGFFHMKCNIEEQHKKRNNPENLQPGDIVILDNYKSTESTVVIVSMTPQQLFSRVHASGIKDVEDKDCWEVMTKRLSKIK